MKKDPSPYSCRVIRLIPLLISPLGGVAMGVTIDFEAPVYSTASPLSPGPAAILTDRPFDGQDGWSRSTSSSTGVIAVTTAAGEYTAGQALRGESGQTYIGAKASYNLFQPAGTLTFDIQYATGGEIGVGSWDDVDADGLFEQTEGQIQFGVEAVATPYQFGFRAAGFGTRTGSGVGGVAGHWYRFVVTAGEPDAVTGDRVVSMRVRDLTTGSEVDFDPLIAGSQPWSTTVTSAEYGTNAVDCEGSFVRVSGNTTAIDNINGPLPPAPAPEAQWDGGGMNGNWSNAVNWSGDIVPASGSTLLFGDAAQFDVTQDLPAGFTVSGLKFDSAADSYMMVGNPLVLAGTLDNNSPSSQTINLPLQIGSNTNILTTNGAIYLDNAVSGNGGITKSGTLPLLLGGANTFTGGLNVNSGEVLLENDQSGATGGFNVTNAGTAVLNIRYEAKAAVGATSAVVLGVPTSVNTGTATLNVDGSLTSAGSMSLLRGAVFNVTGTVDQSGPLLVEGIGGYGANLNVAAEGRFTYSGSGPVLLRSGTNNAGRGRITVNSGTFVTGQAFDYDSASTFTGLLTLAGGGTLQLSAPVAAVATDIEIVLGDGGGIIDTNGQSTTISALISGTGGLIKAGAGILEITTASTYGGDTEVATGTLDLHFASLPDTAAMTVRPGAILRLDFAGSDTVGSLFLGLDSSPKPVGKYGRIGSIAALGADFETELITGDGLLTVASQASFANWAAGLGLSGNPDADFDADGFADLIEYVLGTDPKASGTGGPSVDTTAANLVFTFSRADASETSDVIVTVEVGTNLSSWTQSFTIGADSESSSVGVEIAENGTAPDTVTVTLTKGSEKAMFARLKAALAR